MELVYLKLFVKLNKILFELLFFEAKKKNEQKKRMKSSLFELCVCICFLSSMYLFNIQIFTKNFNINMLMLLMNQVDFVSNEEILLYMHHVQ